MREDFAILILSHGRADNVLTINTLTKSGYTGKWYIVVDNEDNQIEKYKSNFGEEHIIVFDKEKSRKNFDIMDNFEGKGVPTFARNVFHIIAKWLGLKYFLELEDDYVDFSYRYVEEETGKFKRIVVKDLDRICNCMLDFLDNTNALTVAFAQGGDFIGGSGSKVWRERITRKAMNSFFCRVDRQFTFYGRFNDDVNAYTELGKKGYLFFTIRDIMLDQKPTQTNKGGITDAYLQYGTYVKSYYSVMLNPAFIKIYQIGTSHKRLHHIINWENAVPKIINERWKNK